MGKIKILNLIICGIFILANNLNAQNIGYYDAPYIRYEADLGTLANGAAVTSRSYNQWDLQSEASGQVCVNLPSTNSSIQWTISSDGDGLVVRYCVPEGQTGILEVYANGTWLTDLTLTTYYSWESLYNNGNPNNNGVINEAPKMRFDEVRLKLSSKILTGGNLRLVRKSGSANIYIDFAELELIPPEVGWAAGNLTYTGNGSDLQNFIDNNGGATIYLPAKVYNVNRELYFGVDNTVLKGAGMWHTQIHFTNGGANQGGLRANAYGVSYSGLYLTTVRNSRSNSYKAINGVYTGASRISNVWAEHFECGAWIADYNPGGAAIADGFLMSHCRFRNNYADGTNLCKGTANAIVEHCSYRNNGDDDMAIWSAEGWECQRNTFRYNTSENCWRASGCAIYGGFNNSAYNLLIQDNVEVGIKVNNAFAGAGFNGTGANVFSNIKIKRCGTNNDLFNKAVGAIDLGSYDWGAGTRVQNVRFSCIEIIDSKNDAIYIKKVIGTSDGFYGLVFENITINGTGTEYPYNNNGGNTDRGYGILFKGYPNGNATYCGITFANRGGNASSDINTSEKGSLSWGAPTTSCPGGCSIASPSTSITSSSTFGLCTNPVTLTATTSIPSGNTVNFVEFFVDNVSIGQDNSSSYSISWNNPTVGVHQVQAIAHYSGGTTSVSSLQSVTVADGIYSTTTIPVINGTAEGLWGSYAAKSIDIVSVGSITGPTDLSANFKIMRDASNLYLFVDVTDSDLRNDGGNGYDNDGLELFIDMGNDKFGSYGSNDFGYSFLINDPTVYESKHSPASLTGVTFAQGIKSGGYTMEIKIPWTTLGGVPASGAFMGFDLHVNDDDGGGTRDAKIAWKDATDNAWQNPSLLGTLQIAGCNNPLPIELLSFTGETINESVLLKWVTTAEINNKKFVIERSGDHLSEWETIGEVPGTGNLTSINNYSFIDYNPLDGNGYYRLRQMDNDGTTSYSNVVVVEKENVVLNVISPFADDLIIRSSSTGNMEVYINDISGRILYHTNQEITNGIVSIHPSLSIGAYLVTIKTETFIDRQIVIKK